MIEHPKVGQRVVVKDMYGTWRIATIFESSGHLFRAVDGGWSGWFALPFVYDASALRAEAKFLTDAADKLESEAPNAD